MSPCTRPLPPGPLFIQSLRPETGPTAYTQKLWTGGYRVRYAAELCPHLPPRLQVPPAPLISPSNSFFLSTLKTGISASECQFQLGEAGTQQGLPPRQIYRAINLSLVNAGRGFSQAGPAQPTWLFPVSRVHLEWIACPGSEGDPEGAGFCAAEEGRTSLPGVGGEGLVNTCVSSHITGQTPPCSGCTGVCGPTGAGLTLFLGSPQ